MVNIEVRACALFSTFSSLLRALQYLFPAVELGFLVIRLHYDDDKLGKNNFFSIF